MPQISFDPAATLKEIQDESATIIHIVPTNLAAFLLLPDIDQYDLSSIKSVFYAASPMTLELLKKGMEKWGQVFVQGYGTSETGPNISLLSIQAHNVLDRPPEEQEVLYSAGTPFQGVHVRIVDENIKDLPPGEVGRLLYAAKV
jgi:acyl-coenzyme A synthetase/AMP-(fatty) acid ligase